MMSNLTLLDTLKHPLQGVTQFTWTAPQLSGGLLAKRHLRART